MDADPLLSFIFAAGAPGGGVISHDVSVWKIFLTIFLVLLNGFFVAAEFAIVKIRSSQIDVRTDLNPGVAKMAKRIVNSLDSYLAATQLGITLASLGLGFIGESAISPIIINIFDSFGLTGPEWEKVAVNTAIWGAFAVITVLHIVFGELAPKSLAIRFPTNTTFTVAWPLRIFYVIFKPLIWLMNGFANFILRIIGIKPIHGSEIHSEEELKMIITESQEGGAIEQTERDLIQNVFEFDDRRVNNIQTLRKNVSAVEINTPVKEAIDYAVNEGYSRYPVYEETLDNIKGILYTKDLMRLMLDEPENTSFVNILRKPLFISESSKIKNLLKQFQKKRIQMAVVTNEIGELTGIVSMEDILEELVGEIQDEYDNEDPIVINISEGIYSVDAHSNLSDINRHLPYRFEESEHYDTLSGLLAETFPDRELKAGDILDLKDYQVKIIKMYRNSVERAELTLTHLTEEEADNE
ncbi:hemolysin family protein [Moheibacter sp.]|uniref:hemolysin family protein n=1 Tax=Moheibacter sp. TaxID=1965316 RepID=UPI003C730239